MSKIEVLETPQAELERLRAEVQSLEAQIAGLVRKNRNLLAEVRRLRGWDPDNPPVVTIQPDS